MIPVTSDKHFADRASFHTTQFLNSTGLAAKTTARDNQSALQVTGDIFAHFARYVAFRFQWYAASMHLKQSAVQRLCPEWHAR
eukprot:465315-Amphidinium_carterae.1